MHPKHLLVFAIAALILFSSSVPVYASHVKKAEPTADEKSLLIFVGGFNGLVLPIGLTIFVYVAACRRDLI